MNTFVSRRAALTSGGLALLAASGVLGRRRSEAAAAELRAQFTLPALPYAFDALEPHIDARTMEIHHDKHHQAYVNNLNLALRDQPDQQGKSIEDLLKGLASLPESIRTAVRNNGGGHYNHSLFWSVMQANGGGEPKGALAESIAKDLGGFASFKAAFNKAATTRFGSGWAWLIRNGEGKLSVTSMPNQDNPLMNGSGTPLLGLDVWEHAYYLKYQNRRPEYIAAWWNTVNWDEVDRRFRAARPEVAAIVIQCERDQDQGAPLKGAGCAHGRRGKGQLAPHEVNHARSMPLLSRLSDWLLRVRVSGSIGCCRRQRTRRRDESRRGQGCDYSRRGKLERAHHGDGNQGDADRSRHLCPHIGLERRHQPARHRHL